VALIIREATPADADDLTQLARRAKASWGYPEAWLREWRSQLSFSADYIGSNPVYVATSVHTLAGVIALEDSAEPEIAHLWVAPENQGLGVGRQLVQRAVEVAAPVCGVERLLPVLRLTYSCCFGRGCGSVGHHFPTRAST
jgi:GNAT superfamily N-acetyltransferase